MVYDFHNILHLNHSLNTVKEVYQEIKIEVPRDWDLLHFRLVGWPMTRITDVAVKTIQNLGLIQTVHKI